MHIRILPTGLHIDEFRIVSAREESILQDV